MHQQILSGTSISHHLLRSSSAKMSLLRTTALLGSLAASVSAHGYVQGIVAGGTYYTGYSPSFQYQDPAPVVIGWSDPEDLDNGYVAPSAYSDPNIICHKGATPGQTSAKIAAGDVVELQWNTWPESHHGPVIDYLAKCPGDCTDVDKTTLEFFKISQGGLVDDSSVPGTWASDQLIANNNSWAVTIPTSIAPGSYVLRHEIIALHSAGQADGAQNYPQCINLEITGSGTDTPAGTLGTALYKEDDPGVLVNIYASMASYTIPGPSLYSGAVSMSQTEVPIASDAPASTGSSTSWVAASTTAASVMSTPTAAASSSFTFYSNTTATASSSSAPASSSAAASSSSYAAPSSSAAPVASSSSSYAAPASPSTTSCRTTIYTSKPSSTSAANAIPAASSVSYAAAPSSSSEPAPASTSAASAPAPSSSSGDDKPSLPAGYGLDDLLSTVTYYLKAGWKASGNTKRDHPRMFKRV